MKNITKTITSRNATIRIYNFEKHELEDVKMVVCGENASVDRKLDNNRLVLEILEASEPTTKTYVVSVDKFIENAIESEQYMYGFINRTIGGEVAKVLAYNLTTNENEQIEMTKASERQLVKELEKDNYKFIMVLDTYKVDEKYYYMTEEKFMEIANEK